MRLTERVWAYVVGIFTLSPVPGPVAEPQAPLLGFSDVHHVLEAGPIFKPPGGAPSDDFTCDYTAMPGFLPCSTEDNRGCWLRNKQTGQEYNISTNYEDTNQTPVGIHRTYYLNVTDGQINADGMNFPYGKKFNATYPGPWLQACWGDNVSVIVTNELQHNGTSIHWHGIRQWQTMHMDGVNGVTQCPIAPQDSFNYTWRAMQYGSSWYHSHYSVQYADGVHGPLTLHGPSSAPFDEPKRPILMTDWGHNSAFEAITSPAGLKNPSILLNGVGNLTRFNNNVKVNAPKPYTLNFERQPGRPKRYLLRLINTSFDSTFVFSIDNHMLSVIGADFVPIKPYNTTSVLVGIGQRYHVIVEAKPLPSDGEDPPADGNFWIRTWKADCFRFNQNQASPGYEKTGVLRYTDSDARPTSSAWLNIPIRCSDEEFANLNPILPWTVQRPPANDPLGGVGENLTVQASKQPDIFPLALFSMGGDTFNPLQIRYGDPTFLHLNYPGKFDPLTVVYTENYTNTDWVYLVLKGKQGNTFGAHPIHLHGHDYAILQQIENAKFPEGLNLKFNNPPRRDVVLLPNNGYVVIAFKTDNPGVWLMHCHIAFHASFGLAIQIMERQKNAANILPSLGKSHALQETQRVCNNWNRWWGDCNNWWTPKNGPSSCLGGEDEFSPDSGI